MVLNETIKEERERLEWSRNKLARKLGVSYQVIVRWEKGKSMPPLNMVIKMARIFNRTVHYMVTGTNPKQQKSYIEVNIKNLPKNLEKVLQAYQRQEVAKMLHMSVSSFYAISHGKRIPMPDIIETIARALKVNIDDLLL